MISDEFVNEVRLLLINTTIATTRAPDAAAVAAKLARPEADVREAFGLLGERHVYVVEPSDGGRMRMVNPFSTVPTRFHVDAGGRSYFGNCVWDGLGIVSVLGGDGVVRTSCPDCGEPLQLEVAGRQLVGSEGVVHFSVPLGTLGTTSFSPEARCCSSGRKTTSKERGYRREPS